MRPALSARARIAKNPASAVFPTFTGTIKVAKIGDSRVAFGNFGKNVPSAVVTRAADGAVDVPATSNLIYGSNNVYICNAASDHSFEVAARNTYSTNAVDLSAANHLPTSAAAVASPPGATSTTLDTNGRITSWDRHDTRGSWWAFNGALKGGIEFVGNFGHGGVSPPITSKIAYMLSFNPDIVMYENGINPAKATAWSSDAAADAAAASIWVTIKQDLDQITGLDGGGGNKPVIVNTITAIQTGVSAQFARVNMRVVGEPLSGQSGYLATSLNARLMAYQAANPSRVLVVNTFANSIDKATDSSNWRLLAASSTDGVHLLTTWCGLNGATEAATFAPYYTPVDYLPRQSTDTTAANGHTRKSTRGPWFGTGTTAAINTGASGLVPTGWGGGRTAGTGTVAFSVVDPGDSKRMQVQAVCTVAASGDNFTIWPFGSGGITLATLGVAIGDEIDMAFQVNYTGGNAGGLSCIVAAVPYTPDVTQYATMGEINEVAASGQYPDTMTNQVFRSGWCKIGSASAMVPGIILKFRAAGTFTILIDCLAINKR